MKLTFKLNWNEYTNTHEKQFVFLLQAVVQHVVAMGSWWVADIKEAVGILQGQIRASLMEKTGARNRGSRGGCSFSGPTSPGSWRGPSRCMTPANRISGSSIVPIDSTGTSLQGSADLGSNFTRCERSQIRFWTQIRFTSCNRGLSRDRAG